MRLSTENNYSDGTVDGKINRQREIDKASCHPRSASVTWCADLTEETVSFSRAVIALLLRFDRARTVRDDQPKSSLGMTQS